MVDKRTKKTELKQVARNLPRKSGVYIMRDIDGEIIYVGKAKDLRARVSSYFTGEKDIKTHFLVERIAEIEPIITSSEYEALLLENNLIKQHSPRYNIDLRDGKSYPVIKITNETYPRVFKTRNIIQDGSEYFGPYSNVRAVDIYIDLIHKLYPIRRCKKLRKRSNPCLYYHIDCCPAPCTNLITKENYLKTIQKIRSTLSGRTVMFKKELEKKMKVAVAELAFEQAAEFRDALASLEIIEKEPDVMDFKEESRDYIDFQKSGRHIIFAIMRMRGGNVTGREFFASEYAGDSTEALPQFLFQYYLEKGRERPETLIVPTQPDFLTNKFFSDSGWDKLQICLPRNKRDNAILAMVRQNAEIELTRRARETGDLPALESLKNVMQLKKIPQRIEGFDIAQLHGKHTVASMVLFVDGRPERSGYRHYKIQSTLGKVDDYLSISEAVARRYQRLLNENKPLPDLILVDGGKGQVSAALKVLDSLDIVKNVSLAGLSKQHEEIWLPGKSNAIRLPEGDPGLRILQHVRDEAHRFATGHNKKLRAKDLALSTLEGVPGIGPTKSAKLITAYKSLEGIYGRTASEIATTAGVGETVGETVREFLGRALESRETAKDRIFNP